MAASLAADSSLTDALWRGVVGGVVGHLVAWVAAVAWWQTVLRAETVAAVQAARLAREERLRAHREERERRRRDEAPGT